MLVETVFGFAGTILHPPNKPQRGPPVSVPDANMSLGESGSNSSSLAKVELRVHLKGCRMVNGKCPSTLHCFLPAVQIPLLPVKLEDVKVKPTFQNIFIFYPFCPLCLANWSFVSQQILFNLLSSCLILEWAPWVHKIFISLILG